MKIQKRKPLKINTDMLRHWHSKGKSDNWIAKKLGVDQSGVSRARQRLGLKPNFLCNINDNDKKPHEIYVGYIKRSREYKKENKEILDRKAKFYRSLNQNKKRHREYERDRRARARELREQSLLKKGHYIPVCPYTKREIIDGESHDIQVQGYLRAVPERVEHNPKG